MRGWHERSTRAGRVNQQPFHFADRLLQSNHDGASHDTVADVQLTQLGKGGDRLHILIVQSVSRMQHQT